MGRALLETTVTLSLSPLVSDGRRHTISSNSVSRSHSFVRALLRPTVLDPDGWGKIIDALYHHGTLSSVGKTDP